MLFETRRSLPSLPDDKSALRAHFRQRRSDFVGSMTSAERQVSFSRLPSPLVARMTPDMIVAGYAALGAEAPAAQLMAHASELGCRLALPHITSRTAPMRFLSWDGRSALEPGPFGLQQPATTSAVVRPDLVLVPLLAFDRRLNRLGQGGGHYDRALSILPGASSVGLAWSVQEADLLATDPWDVPLDAILTEREFLTS